LLKYEIRIPARRPDSIGTLAGGSKPETNPNFQDQNENLKRLFLKSISFGFEFWNI
jgi:hypothetical protein